MHDNSQKDGILESFEKDRLGEVEKLRNKQDLLKRYRDELPSLSLDQQQYYENKIKQVEQEIPEIRSKIESLEKKIEERKNKVQSLNSSLLTVRATEELTDGDLIREIENRLSNDLAYWREDEIPILGKSTSYTACYFHRVWDSLNSIRNRFDSSNIEEFNTLISSLENQILQANKLIKGIDNHSLLTSFNNSSLRIQKETTAIKNNIRKMKANQSQGSQSPQYYYGAINAQTSSLKLSLGEFQKEIEQLISKANESFDSSV